MTTYQQNLKTHLARYKIEHLGVQENGIWTKNREAYPHILPQEAKWLNIIETIREECCTFKKLHPEIKLQQDFHHLNSSQGLCFNLFFPFFYQFQNASLIFLNTIGIKKQEIKDWGFERILCPKEGTNFDFYLKLQDNTQIFFELKLSEVNFGRAVNDDRHKSKLTDIYRPRLKNLVSISCLESKMFFENYQILRNVYYANPETNDRVMFIFPAANKSLSACTELLDSVLYERAKDVIKIFYLEDFIDSLISQSKNLEPTLSAHLELLREKYVPIGSVTEGSS